jgi:hypothetical protein
MSETEAKTATHTPGPWAVDEDGEITGHEGGTAIGRVYMYADFPCLDPDDVDQDVFDAESQADGRLMAAAPDLLDAAVLALEELEDFARGRRSSALMYYASIDEYRAGRLAEAADALRNAIKQARAQT